MRIKIKRFTATAKLPLHGSVGQAGYDLFADRMEKVDNGYVYYTGIGIQMPESHCALVLPRSSIVKTGLFMGNSVGLIDRDFTGEISCVFYDRQGVKPYEIGDRIAQLLIFPIPKLEFEEVEELPQTERGTGGYGSTGR